MGIVDRFILAARQAARTNRSQVKQFSTSQGMRGGGAQGWAYKNWDPAPALNIKIGIALQTFTYWWIFHGVFTEPEHLFGHEPYLDVTQLTDEELRIPPASRAYITYSPFLSFV